MTPKTITEDEQTNKVFLHYSEYFAQIIQAKSGHVGCAMVQYVRDGTKYLLAVCNYSFGNVQNESIYEKGKPCSKCATGCSANSPSLCKTKEEDILLQVKVKLLNTNVKVKDFLKLKKTLGITK